MMVRQYIQQSPSHPLEQAGTVENRLNGVRRHVVYLEDGSKVVTWDFTDDKWGEE